MLEYVTLVHFLIWVVLPLGPVIVVKCVEKAILEGCCFCTFSVQFLCVSHWQIWFSDFFFYHLLSISAFLTRVMSVPWNKGFIYTLHSCWVSTQVHPEDHPWSGFVVVAPPGGSPRKLLLLPHLFFLPGWTLCKMPCTRCLWFFWLSVLNSCDSIADTQLLILNTFSLFKK